MKRLVVQIVTAGIAQYQHRPLLKPLNSNFHLDQTSESIDRLETETVAQKLRLDQSSLQVDPETHETLERQRDVVLADVVLADTDP